MTKTSSDRYSDTMPLQNLETIAFFIDEPYDSSASYSVRACTNDDWDVEDLFGDIPEIVRMYRGDISHQGNLDLVNPDEYGFYVIDGSLDIEGVLFMQISDMYNPLVIVGDLRAQSVVLTRHTHLYVLGKTEITGALVTDLADGGGCYLRGGSAFDCFLDLNGQAAVQDERGAALSPTPLASRYDIDKCDDPFAQLLEDLRAGRSVR